MNIQTRHPQWRFTPDGEPRGFITPRRLQELWFHTGTKCNLSCDFCLEGSSPSDKRLLTPKFEQVKPFIDEALNMGVEQFSFTGGEPFLAKDIIKILDYASQHKPCLVLTNGTEPLQKRFESLKTLLTNPHPIACRISLDYPTEDLHEKGRGKGTFAQSMKGLQQLHQAGFGISVARHIDKGEDTQEVDAAYRALFSAYSLPTDLNIVAFPDFLPPGSIADVPYVTEHCMITYQTEEQKANYMCANSKMVILQGDTMKVIACTLVDDDSDYVLGYTLHEAMQENISMKHHRCYSCFSMGASCSEL